MENNTTRISLGSDKAAPRGWAFALPRLAAGLMVLLPLAALAQTPADIARLSGASAVPAAVSVAQAPLPGSATPGDLARLMPVVPGSGYSAPPAHDAAAGAFTAADLAKQSTGASVWYGRETPALTASR